MSNDTPEANKPIRQGALDAVNLRPTRQTRSAVAHQQTLRDIPIALSYLRVSTKDQARTGGGAEGYSLPAQRDACLAKAAQLGAVIQQEYIDAGESARSADRDQLQQLLKDVKTIKPDYVIVHKIDRLARNREDDIAINLLLKKNNARLVSCTENIDDTPSGKLLYGLMAELAQFYSGNLAQEVMKGLLRKAEEGGTPFRAPLGYLNVRTTVGGVTFASVILDPERADLVRWCFEQYATGECTVNDLTLAVQAKGLVTRTSPSRTAQPIPFNTLLTMLRNPYYMGLVAYQGIHYEGKHPVLIEPDVWLDVQNILSSRNHAGEKDRKHPHYLRGTIYCSACGGRLVYSENTGNGGTYTYYVCLKKKTRANNCRRPAVRLERIEDGIAAHYARFHISAERVEVIQAGVRAELAAQQHEAERSVTRAMKRKTQFQDERLKLMQAHYAGAVPADLLAAEMKRLTRSLAEADVEITAAKATTTDLEATLTRALTAAAHCQQAYLTAPDDIKRQINQGFFKKLFINEDGEVETAELTEPFTALLDTDQVTLANMPTNPANVAADDPISPAKTPDPVRPSDVFTASHGDEIHVTERIQENHGTSDFSNVPWCAKDDLVGAAGIEPATARV